jgi:tetratricopeptide (TPR) repeat protein
MSIVSKGGAMQAWLKITELVSKLEAKDWIALTVSAFALLISVLSFRQKSGESRLALRKQLTDLCEKLVVLNTEDAKCRAKPNDYPPGYTGMLNDQRRFFARQAAFIAAKISNLVSTFEYVLLARGHDDINDWSQAEEFFRLAKSTARNSIDRGIATQKYGQYLYGHGLIKQAREEFDEALKCFEGSADRVRVFRANTFIRRSDHEKEWTNNSEALRVLEEAEREYQQLDNPTQRDREVDRVRALISRLKQSSREPSVPTNSPQG